MSQYFSNLDEGASGNVKVELDLSNHIQKMN